jgi:hypothetical protein
MAETAAPVAIGLEPQAAPVPAARRTVLDISSRQMSDGATIRSQPEAQYQSVAMGGDRRLGGVSVPSSAGGTQDDAPSGDSRVNVNVPGVVTSEPPASVQTPSQAVVRSGTERYARPVASQFGVRVNRDANLPAQAPAPTTPRSESHYQSAASVPTSRPAAIVAPPAGTDWLFPASAADPNLAFALPAVAAPERGGRADSAADGPATATSGAADIASTAALISPAPGAADSRPAADSPASAPRSSARHALDQVVSQTLQEASLQSDPGSRSVQLRLDPPELGKMVIEIHRSSDGDLSVHLSSSSGETHALLEQHADDIVQALGDQGVSLSNFDLSHQQHGASEQAQSFFDRDDAGYRPGESAPEAAAGDHSARPSLPGEINFRA